MSLDLTEDKSTLFQIMAWCRQATSHYLSQCWPRSVSPNCVIRPQWVKLFLSQINCFLFSSPNGMYDIWVGRKNTNTACSNCSRRPQAQVSGGDATRNLCLWPPGAGCVTPECPSRPVTLSLVSVTCLCHQLVGDSWANRHLECHPLLQYLEMILPRTWLIFMVYGSFVYGIIFVVYCTVWSYYFWPIFC